MESVQPVFTVKSVADSIRWYETVLGFTTTYRNEREGEPESVNYAVLSSGPVGLHLGLERDMENVAGQGACNFATAEFDGIHARAREENAQFFIELGKIPTGQRTFGIKDPDGNLITFVEASI